jgi:hypothetical protein
MRGFKSRRNNQMPTFKKLPPELSGGDNEPTSGLMGSLRARTNSKSFSRGQEYQRSGMVLEISRDGEMIYGECQGSEDMDYDVEVRIRGNDIIEADCSCPYEGDGDCKHIVALVLTYMVEYATVVDVSTTSAQVRPLAERSKEELIGLVEEMVSLHRDLKSLLNCPSPGNVKNHDVDLRFVRDNLKLAIKQFEPYRNNHVALNYIRTIIKTARTFADEGDWHNTARICRALWDTLNSDNEYPVYDQNGDFVVTLVESIPLLEECLNQPDFHSDAGERYAILDCLLRTILWNTHHEQMGDSIYELQDLLTAFTTPDDLPTLKGAIETKLRSLPSKNYLREPLIELLNDLDYAIHPDPQVLIDRFTAEQDFGRLAMKYIEWERYDEAISTLKKPTLSLWELTTALNALIHHHQAKEAIALAVERMEQTFEPSLADWLISTYTQRGNHAAALEWAQRRMIHQPTINTYKTLKEIAIRLSQWKAVRAKFYEEFAWEDKHPMLFDMYMEDQEWDRAWNLLPRLTPRLNSYYMPGNDIRLAMASYRTHPSQALPILQKLAESQISRRERSAYAEAATTLGMVRTAFEALSQKPHWQRYIAELRETYKKLPAFQDELRKAGL